MSAAIAPYSSSPSASALRLQRQFQRECVQLFGEVVQGLGVPRSAGQIYGLLFASPKLLSFSEIVAQLEISKGSASQGIKTLRALGAIKLVAQEGGRSGEPIVGKVRNYFEPELSLRKLVSGIMYERIVPMIVGGADRYERFRRIAITAESGKQDSFLIERVGQLETWQKRFRIALPLLSALFGPKKQ